MRILAIESSCDETGAAIIEDGRIIRANVVASQASVHARYGGVVPEVASRQQLSALIPTLDMAFSEAGLGWGAIDAVAATYGPGLAGSLLIGLTAGKTLALARGLPFLGVNHLEAHIYANWLRPNGETIPPAARPAPSASARKPIAPASVDSPGAHPNALETLHAHDTLDMLEEWPGDPQFPLLALVISGAHTELVSIPQHGRYELLGQTRDDAVGEAFDKVSRLLGLGYPGGPAIERAAASRDTTRANPYKLPRAWMRGTHDFSFSGLKTAVLELVESALDAQDGQPGRNNGAAQAAAATSATAASSGKARAGQSASGRYRRKGEATLAAGAFSVPDLAEAFQESVVDVLAAKTTQAARELGVRQVLLAGGVAANLALRERLTGLLTPDGIALRYPPVALCTDNAAMIGAAAYFHLRLGERSGLDLDVRPGLQLPFASR